MARLVNGILGGLSGRIGDFEGYIRNGLPYVRKKRSATRLKPSPAVTATRQRMALVNRFIGSMTDFVRIGFSLTAAGQAFSANNAAKSYQIRNALGGQQPDFVVDYSRVRLTEGNLENPQGLSAAALSDGVMFSWNVDPQEMAQLQQSRTMLLVYCGALNRSVFLIGGASRYRGSDLLDIPEEFRGLELQCYIGFITDDRLAISNSVWLGVIVV